MEVKDVFGYLGYDAEKVKSIEDLKSQFEKDFVRASSINEDNEFIKPILGKTFGTQENELKKIAKEFEFDIEGEDFKEAKKVTDKMKILTKKIAELKDSSIKELQTKLSQGSDEKVKDYEAKLEKIKKEAKEKDSLLKQTADELNNLRLSSSNELKNFKLDLVKKDAFNQVKYNSQANELTKKGFYANIYEKYDFDFNEKGDAIIRLKNGTQLKSDKVAGAFMSPYEVLEKEAIDAGIYETNPNASKQVANAVKMGVNTATVTTQPVISTSPQRTIAPRLK